MEIIIELLLQFLGELVMQATFELGFHGLVEPFRKKRPVNVLLALFGYVLLGAISGSISIWVLPNHLIANPLVQYVNLAITPIALGFTFRWLGNRRQAKGKQKRLLDRFSYGFVFALTMGLIRFIFAA